MTTMAYLKIRKAVANLVTTIMLAVSVSTLSTTSAVAADDVTLACKSVLSYAVVDMAALGLNVSAAVPVGTVLYEGSVTVPLKCSKDNILQLDPTQYVGEVYFKRRAIPENALGYGLTIYTGYGGEMSAEAASIPTGIKVTGYAINGGASLNDYTDVTLTVPYQIVRTSLSMEPPKGVRNYVYVFDVGSQVAGTDQPFTFTNIKKVATVKDETCAIAGEVNQNVPLGTYSTSTSSGLGSGIGETSKLVPFNIQLNCESLLSGTFDVKMQFDEIGAVSGLSDLGVVALNSTSTASGVGVQILNENEQPVPLAVPFTVASYPLSAALVTVPLYARYYQTATTVSPGSANAVATYTISYQ